MSVIQRKEDMRTLAGVLPVLSTPFLKSGVVDHAALGRQIDWLLDLGVDGVTVAMVSEYLRLDPDERAQVARTVVEKVAGKAAVVISAGAESTFQTVRQIEALSDLNIDAFMVNPPITVASADTELHDHFVAVIRAAAGTPVIIQDASGYVGQPLPISLLKTIHEQFGSERVMFKPEAEPLGPRLTELLSATSGNAKVFEGSGGRNLIDSHRRGVIGTMPGPDLAWAIIQLWAALEAGDDVAAYRIQEALTPLLNYSSSLDSYVLIEKRLLVEQGVLDSDRYRGPVEFDLDQTTWNEVLRLFDRLRLCTKPSDAGVVAAR